MYSSFIRDSVIAPEPQATSQRSPQPPAMTSLNGGVTKHGSTPSAAATSLPVSASKPEISGAVSWFDSHFVVACRTAPLTANDCGA